jgi:Polyketide cyclase / dehydrase and lipid transport
MSQMNSISNDSSKGLSALTRVGSLFSTALANVADIDAATWATAAVLAITATPSISQESQPPTANSSLERAGIMSMKDDLANRSRDIHWPKGFTPADADLFSHNELFISASCQRVWRHIVEATRWPEWYPNSKAVQVLGDSGSVLEDNSVFRWTTFGLPLESRINEFVPFSRIGWFGYAPGSAPSFYHTWYLTQVGTACRVVTDEVGKGESAIRFRQTDESAMHRGHDLWLAALKWVSESNSNED